jgi:hypothetical protein
MKSIILPPTLSWICQTPFTRAAKFFPGHPGVYRCSHVYRSCGCGGGSGGRGHALSGTAFTTFCGSGSIVGSMGNTAGHNPDFASMANSASTGEGGDDSIHLSQEQPIIRSRPPKIFPHKLSDGSGTGLRQSNCRTGESAHTLWSGSKD